MRRISTYDEFKRWLIAAIDKSAKYRLTRPDLFFAYTNCLRNITALDLNEKGVFLDEGGEKQ